MQTSLKLALLAICFTSTAFAQGKYSILEIPAPLLVKSDAIVRSSETHVVIKNEGSFTYTEKYAITVLNSAGDEFAYANIFYDKLMSVRTFEGNLYDAGGVKIKSLKKNDIKDYSSTSSGTLADDNRVKTHKFYHHSYPYTVEYETSVIYNGLFYFPSWTPVKDENISVQKSTLIVELPLDYNLRYKTYKIDKEPEVQIGKTKSLIWEVGLIPSVKSELFSIPWYESTPSVFLAPTAFTIQDYNGNMADWASFGKFLYKLNEGRDKLPDAIRSKVHQLTEGLNEKEKIISLYKYMQENTRYISVQLGLGGWQTFDASYVATNGYGDCKALSNYMYSLLKEAGIKSIYTLVKSGQNNNSFMADFPSNQFNHVILCVPMDKDSMWLECTSQTAVPGYLGGFTSNRNALLIGEYGGKLVTTPKYSGKQNLQIRKINSVLDLEGNLTIKSVTRYQAEQQDEMHGMLEGVSRERMSEILKDRLSIASFDIIKFDYTQNRTELPSITENLEVKAFNYATVTNKRIFITPNILNRSSVRISDADKRVNPIRISFEYTDSDSIEVIIPEGYMPETQPEPTVLVTKFAKYSSSVVYESGKIIYTRTIERPSGYYAAIDAKALAEFYAAVYKADRARLVLIKKD